MAHDQHSRGLSHLAVTVQALTDEYRAALLEFYGHHFGWTELEAFRRPDRLTISVGGGDYLNVRERAVPMECSDYEHFGLLMLSAEAVEGAWAALADDERTVDLEPLSEGPGSYRSFRFRYLLPMAIEVQHIPSGR